MYATFKRRHLAGKSRVSKLVYDCVVYMTGSHLTWKINVLEKMMLDSSSGSSSEERGKVKKILV